MLTFFSLVGELQKLFGQLALSEKQVGGGDAPQQYLGGGRGGLKL